MIHMKCQDLFSSEKKKKKSKLSSALFVIGALRVNLPRKGTHLQQGEQKEFFQLVVWAGLEPTTFSTAVNHSNHSAMMPLLSSTI